MTTLTIENMHCGACVRRVTNALSALPDARVEEVRVGAAQLETSAGPAAILAAIAKAGFPAQIVAE